ncbi:hypothetical protein RM863_08735 [Streptomyces sp. DSM 41014]|uniref:Uncharacterized protein n=1 Tax=Streptomyces hintoniae TaxID=3075521 RepID=A0ABU2UG53_9ACTN|nr:MULTISPECIES: hypothetical protein [unclassified Streptomyces]MDH6696051.1 hypothetical protein [Streptomyces sp. MAA16]MDT0472211.1 hypothetical protein [Streptomyces sp. DSM 41014]
MTDTTAHGPASRGKDPADDEYEPKIGELVEDPATRRVGRVMGAVGPYMQLRPVEGGREWDADPTKVRPVPVGDALSAAVATANARSTGML